VDIEGTGGLQLLIDATAHKHWFVHLLWELLHILSISIYGGHLRVKRRTDVAVSRRIIGLGLGGLRGHSLIAIRAHLGRCSSPRDTRHHHHLIRVWPLLILSRLLTIRLKSSRHIGLCEGEHLFEHLHPAHLLQWNVAILLEFLQELGKCTAYTVHAIYLEVEGLPHILVVERDHMVIATGLPLQQHPHVEDVVQVDRLLGWVSIAVSDQLNGLDEVEEELLLGQEHHVVDHIDLLVRFGLESVFELIDGLEARVRELAIEAGGPGSLLVGEYEEIAILMEGRKVEGDQGT
jgi:hypothetical protein